MINNLTSYTFKVDNQKYMIVNYTRSTSSGFAHDSHLLINQSAFNPNLWEKMGKKLTANYTNRTWESFQYASVMNQLITNYFKDEFHDDIKKQISNYKF
jgi:hypothetical protein